MLKRAKRRNQDLPFSVELLEVGAESLPFPDEFFDTIVITWVICTLPQPNESMREIVRVLKPEGKVLWVEHTHSRFPLAQRIQGFLNPLWRKVAGGCNMDRKPVVLMKEHGLVIDQFRPRGRESWNLFPIYQGIATKQKSTDGC